MNREAMRRRIRTALDAKPEPEAARAKAVASRLAQPPPNPKPAFAELQGAEREQRFISCLEALGTSVLRATDGASVAAAVNTVLDTITPRPRLVLGDDPRLLNLPWGTVPPIWDLTRFADQGSAAMTHAEAGVAETGTLVMLTGPHSPATLSFLPETHIVLLDRRDILASFEDAFARISKRYDNEPLPRAINLISGASRTGDIGGKIVKGAHGPRRLAVVLYETLQLSA